MARTISEREINLHCAKVYLREARVRRHRDPAFSATLLMWAANARRRAAASTPVQPDLFPHNSEVR